MNLDVQFKIRSNPVYIYFLRNNSYWYKTLTRDPSQIKSFEQSYKNYNKSIRSYKFSKTLEYIEMFQTILTNIK